MCTIAKKGKIPTENNDYVRLQWGLIIYSGLVQICILEIWL